ncbi:glutamyl-tRNA reductase, partial [Pyxidicoccus sp. 3LFB2]
EVERTLGTLGDGLNDKQRRSIEAMGRAIVNKLLHEPTSRLRAVGPEGEGNRLAGAAAELFGLLEGEVEEPAEQGSSAPVPITAQVATGAKR